MYVYTSLTLLLRVFLSAVAERSHIVYLLCLVILLEIVVERRKCSCKYLNLIQQIQKEF